VKALAGEQNAQNRHNERYLTATTRPFGILN